MKEFTSSTGTKVAIHEASFKDAIALKNSAQKAFLAQGIALSIETDLMQAIFALDSNEEVSKNIFKCLARSTYGSLKITEETFEPVEARNDYYEIVLACLEVNLLPFFKALTSKLAEAQANKESVLKQQSQLAS